MGRTRHFRLEIRRSEEDAKGLPMACLGLGISVTDEESSREPVEQAVSAAVELETIWPDASLRELDGHGGLVWESACKAGPAAAE
jgi:hypothetical protein